MGAAAPSGQATLPVHHGADNNRPPSTLLRLKVTELMTKALQPPAVGFLAL